MVAAFWVLTQLCLSAPVAITKYHSPASTTEMSFLTVLNAGSPRSRSCRLEHCWELLWWTLFCRGLTWWREKTGISSSSYEGTNLVRLGPCCLNSFKPLPPPLRPCFQIQSHWELGLSCMNTGGWETWTLRPQQWLNLPACRTLVTDIKSEEN